MIHIEEYIAGCAPDVRPILEDIRATIRAAAPEAVEGISYGMPCFKQNGILVYFAAFKNHIGFYPTGSTREKFSEVLASFKGGKGTVQFPLNQPIPYGIISDIVTFRVGENLEKARLRSIGKSKRLF